MINYGTIRSTVEPEALVIDDCSVWINTNIHSVQVTHEGDTHTEYEYNQVQYGKDEYIKLMDTKNGELEEQLTDTELALVEIYEIIGE